MARERLAGGENVVMDTRQEGEISRQEENVRDRQATN